MLAVRKKNETTYVKPDAAVPKSSSSVTSAESRWWSVPMSDWTLKALTTAAEGGRREAGRQGVLEGKEASLTDEREGPGREVGDEVPDEGGEPVGRDRHARDELEVLRADLLLLDDREGPERGDEHHAQDDDDREVWGERGRARDFADIRASTQSPHAYATH